MAKVDTSLIVIEKIIIHDVPKHKKNETGIEPIFSEQESEITDGLRLFFKGKINSALQSDRSFKICYDSESDSQVPLYVSKILSDEKDFIEQSRAITQRLFDIQAGNNAAGIVMIIRATIKGLPVCIILKLERDKGAQLKLDAKTRTYNAAEVENLMLTEKTKIYKVALFIDRGTFKTKHDGMIADYQINITTKRETNTFFMDDFLGCKPYSDPKITTKAFYDLTYSYINTIENPITKAKYIEHLNSYLQKNQTTISPREFATDYFEDTQHKNDYKKFLELKSFSFGSFLKENTLVESHIRKILIDFDNGISILGTGGTLDDNVKLEELKNGLHKAEITAKIKKVK